MQLQTEVVGTNGGARGRKVEEGMTNLAFLKEDIAELVDLYIKKQLSAELCSEAIKASAKKAGLMPDVVTRFVKARAGHKFAEEERKVWQMSLVFDEVGEG